MKWTLVAPGSLLPPALAPGLVQAMRAPRLAKWLAAARPLATLRARERSAGAAHWSWLARAFGLDEDPPITGPYAWHGDDEAPAPGPWIAQCEPVHLALARDHFVVHDLGAAPLDGAETTQLLALANEALQAPAVRAALPPGANARFALRGTAWFLLSDQALALQTVALDAALGQSAQERMPSGAAARGWRILDNEIQMLWHASEVAAAREQREAPAANALWIHGGGIWRPLPASSISASTSGFRVADDSADAAVLQGWMRASAARDCAGAAATAGAGNTISVYRGLFVPFACQAWESWLEAIGEFEERVAQDMARAREQGASQLDLVLCGSLHTRTLRLPLRPMPGLSWLRALLTAPDGAARQLRRRLQEPDLQQRALEPA